MYLFYSSNVKLLFIITFIFSIASLILNLIFKKSNKILKFNSFIAHIMMILFTIIFWNVSSFFVEKYLLYYFSTIIYIMLDLLLMLTVIITTSINYIFKNKIKTTRILELITLITSIILFFSMIFSNYTDINFIQLTVLTFIFTEYFIVNSNENLEDKISKKIFLTTNIIISSILIISLLLFVIQTKLNIDLIGIIICLFALLFALIPLLTAYKTLKKEKNND